LLGAASSVVRAVFFIAEESGAALWPRQGR
jgi:hypothetical protein